MRDLKRGFNPLVPRDKRSPSKSVEE